MGDNTGKRIEYGDDAYEEVYEEWEENGRPAQFDRTRSSDYGGELIRVRDRTGTPVFFRAASLPPATWDDKGKVQWKDRWPAANEDYFRTRLTIRNGGPTRNNLKVSYIPCPNELD